MAKLLSAPLNEIPEVVFSKTLERADWPETGSPATSSSRRSPRSRGVGGELMAHGGASFAGSLISERLVDEYRLALHPLARGSGLSLSPETAEPLRRELADVRRFDSERIFHTYRNAGPGGSPNGTSTPPGRTGSRSSGER